MSSSDVNEYGRHRFPVRYRVRGRGNFHSDYEFSPYHPANQPSYWHRVGYKAGKYIGTKVAAVEGWKQAFGSYTWPINFDSKNKRKSSGAFEVDISPVKRSRDEEDFYYIDAPVDELWDASVQADELPSNSLKYKMSTPVRVRRGYCVLPGLKPLPRHWSGTKTTVWAKQVVEATPIAIDGGVQAYAANMTGVSGLVNSKWYGDLIVNQNDLSHQYTNAYVSANFVALDNQTSRNSDTQNVPYSLFDFFSVTKGQAPSNDTSVRTLRSFTTAKSAYERSLSESGTPSLIGDQMQSEAIVKVSNTYHIWNPNIYALEFEIYVCLPKRATESWFSADFLAASGTLSDDSYVVTRTSVSANQLNQWPWNKGVYPTQYKKLNEDWSIYKKHKVTLHPGERLEYTVILPPSWVCKQLMQRKLGDNDFYCKGIGHNVFIRAIGAMGIVNTTKAVGETETRGVLANAPAKWVMYCTQRSACRAILGTWTPLEQSSGFDTARLDITGKYINFVNAESDSIQNVYKNDITESAMAEDGA